MKRMFVTALVLIGLIALSLGITYKVAPVWLLDRADRLYGGDQATERAARGVPYGSLPRLKLDIWKPKGNTAEKRPVLIFFYGGGWHWGERDHYGFAGRAFASKGFIVVIPDYRLVPSVRFPDFVADSAAAVRWTQANISKYGGDPSRIAVAGHSAGAYNALMIALDPQWLTNKPVRAAISLSGPADFYPFTTKSSRDAMGAAPDPLATQPVSFVRKDAPPILLIHGEADTTVRIRNAVHLEARQKAAGGDISLIRYPGKEHNPPLMALSTLFRSSLPTLEQSTRFLHEHMKEETADDHQGR